MKKALLLSLAGLMCVPVFGALDLPVVGQQSAIAHPGPHRHHHVRRGHRHRRVYRPHVVVRPRVYVPPPPPVVVVEPPPPVIVYEEPPPTVIRRVPAEPARVVVKRKPKQESDDRHLLGLGLRVSGATLEGGKLGLDTAENPAMGGIGLQLRTRFTKSLGMELAVDWLTGSDGDVDQTTIPVMASLTYHLFPTSRFQPYFLAGAGVHLTRLSYLDGDYNYDMTEIAGQLGAGLEVFITKNLAVNADIRAQTIFKNLDTQAKIHEDCLHRVGNKVGFCDNIHQADPDDKANMGVQLQAGVSWYF